MAMDPDSTSGGEVLDGRTVGGEVLGGRTVGGEAFDITAAGTEVFDGRACGAEVPTGLDGPAARLDVMVSTRVTREEAALLRGAAARAGMSLSAFFRQSALAASRTTVVNLDRVRDDLVRLRELADDALRSLS